MPSQQLIEELRNLVEQERSIKLSKSEVAQIASDLQRLFELLVQHDK